MRLPIAVVLFASFTCVVPAQMTALVNDPNSHGTVGDGLLSLDEAIRVMNVQLPYTSLSTAEQAQLRGFPTTVLDRIEIDYNITPIITIEPGKQLTHVEGDQISHVDTDFYGLNGKPTILAGNTPIIWEVNTNHFHLHDMIMVGGQIGCTFDSTLHYHPGVRARFVDCLFLNQSQIALQINIPAFPPGEVLPIDIDGTVFKNSGVGVEINDAGFGAILDHLATDTLIENCQTGLRINIAGFGSTCAMQWDRCQIIGSENAVEVIRPTSATVFDMTFLHCDFFATQDAFEIQGSAIGAASLNLHHCNLRGGPNAGNHAFRSYPSSARLDFTATENEFDGDVSIQIGNVGAKLLAHNNRFENGPVTVESAGPSPDFERNQFESSPVTVASGSSKPVNFLSCEFIFSSVDDQTAGGQTTLTNCVLDQSAIIGSVTNSSPAPQRWMARASVSPAAPSVGSYVDLAVALQPGTTAAWLLGVGDPVPNLAAQPYRFYFSLLIPTIGLPAPTLRFQIPNMPVLQGVELYAQPVSYPTLGQAYVPLNLPRGGRISIN